MPGAADQVAALEAETAQAVSAAVVAEGAALEAVASAAALQDQLTANNAETVREWSDDLERNKEHIQWMQTEIRTLSTTVEAQSATMEAMQAEILLLSTSAVAASPAPQPSLENPPSVVAVDLQAAVPESPPEPPPSSPLKEKRFKRL